jgi:hypothetical protein
LRGFKTGGPGQKKPYNDRSSGPKRRESRYPPRAPTLLVDERLRGSGDIASLEGLGETCAHLLPLLLRFIGRRFRWVDSCVGHHLRRQEVSIWDRTNIVLPSRVFAELLAQSLHVLSQVTLADVGIGPNVNQETVLGYRDPSVLHQRPERVELLAREGYKSASPPERARDRIDPVGTELERLL